MTADQIDGAVMTAIEDVYREDHSLIVNVDLHRPRFGTERALVAYLFLALHARLRPIALDGGHPAARVDLEYSRAGVNVKALPGEVLDADGEPVPNAVLATRRIVPDIIFHERGEGRRNFLAIEAKPASARRVLPTRPPLAVENDWAKRALLTGQVQHIYARVTPDLDIPDTWRTKNGLLLAPPEDELHARIRLPYAHAQYELGLWVGFREHEVQLRWWRGGDAGDVLTVLMPHEPNNDQ